jgi:hypothetical protein
MHTNRTFTIQSIFQPFFFCHFHNIYHEHHHPSTYQSEKSGNSSLFFPCLHLPGFLTHK